MPLSSFSLTLAVLVVVANVATIGTAALLVAARRRCGALTERIRTVAVPVAAVAATAATAASLLLSGRYGLPPCRLCWYQRYAMYPLGVVLAVAAAAPHRSLRAVAALLAAAGLSVSAYHTLVERFPSLDSGACELANPCSVIWFQRFGFVTIPYGAASVFAFVLGMLLAARGRSPRTDTTTAG